MFLIVLLVIIYEQFETSVQLSSSTPSEIFDNSYIVFILCVVLFNVLFVSLYFQSIV